MKNSKAFPYLEACTLLEGSDEAGRRAFLDECDLRHFGDRSPVLTQGEPTDTLYLIVKGRIEVTYLDSEGNQSILHFAGSGEVVGEVEALSKLPCAASCWALPGTTVLAGSGELLVRHLLAPPLLASLAAILHDRLERGNRLKAADQFYSVDQRICIYLSHFLAVDTGEIGISQAYLAGAVGCARQTVNRKLGELREAGILDVNRGRIRLLDRGALERCCGLEA
ncbi:Crp/Fnr family transcriptional regulator [Salipiger mucosus]|uniref:cAMP-binding protein n=1 Tax=Salipiger mucosus DSM 16094 TaxID=1123237 RepID=S9Q7F3_9RHOB|nr:Crp/Fnr family transcriptional regulator [Salipiger mucosus]EPX75962.1 cAMP-binding protein [Salipiger mucosus DSM 16094]